MEKRKQLNEQLKETKDKLSAAEDAAAMNENVKTLRDLFANLSQSLAKQY